MKVLLDMRASIGGLARYAATLKQALDQQPGIEAIPWGRGSANWGASATALPRGPLRRIGRRLVRFPLRLFDDQWRGPHLARREKVNIIHATSGLAPRTGTCPLVLTCHDLWTIDHPETRPDPVLAAYERHRMETGLRRAHHIITDTQVVASALRQRYGIAEERMTPIFPPLAPLAVVDETAVAALNLPPRFFLSVGTLEPRKNLHRLLDAQSMAYAESRIPLIIAGDYGWQEPTLRDKLARAAPAVRWLGFVPDDVLAGLYERARVFVTFSLEEGFNYPLVEALRAGLPVIASDIPVHREVLAQADAWPSPLDPAALASALVEDARRPDSQMGARRAAARNRAAEIRRQADLSRVLAVYESVCSA